MIPSLEFSLLYLSYTICSSVLFFSIVHFWHLGKISGDHRYVDLYLGPQSCSVALYVYILSVPIIFVVYFSPMPLYYTLETDKVIHIMTILLFRITLLLFCVSIYIFGIDFSDSEECCQNFDWVYIESVGTSWQHGHFILVLLINEHGVASNLLLSF